MMSIYVVYEGLSIFISIIVGIVTPSLAAKKHIYIYIYIYTLTYLLLLNSVY